MKITNYYALILMTLIIAGATPLKGSAQQQPHKITYFGGSGNDRAQGNAPLRDAAGNLIGALVSGNTSSPNLVPGGFAGYDTVLESLGPGISNGEGFVAIFNSNLTQVLNWTYFGGAQPGAGLSDDDRGYQAFQLQDGRIGVSGITQDPYFPATIGPGYGYQGTGFAGFFAILSGDLKNLHCAVLLHSPAGSNGTQNPRNAVAQAPNGDIFIGGYTTSDRFLDWWRPAGIFNGVLQPTKKADGGKRDGIVARISPVDCAIEKATYLGSAAGHDELQTLTVGGDGSVYIGGTVAGPDVPLKHPFQPFMGCQPGDAKCDAYLARLTPDLASTIWATHLGGTGGSETISYNSGGTVDAHGNFVAIGITTSSDVPLGPLGTAVFQAQNGGDIDGFVVRVGPTGKLKLFTYLGGNSFDEPSGVSVDNFGRIAVSGTTSSTNFHTTADAFQQSLAGGMDGSGNPKTAGFVTLLTMRGTAAVYSTFIGGQGGGDRIRDNFLNIPPGGGSCRLYYSGDVATKEYQGFPVGPGSVYDAVHYPNQFDDAFVGYVDFGC